jgi:hypothetical protein
MRRTSSLQLKPASNRIRVRELLTTTAFPLEPLART